MTVCLNTWLYPSTSFRSSSCCWVITSPSYLTVIKLIMIIHCHHTIVSFMIHLRLLLSQEVIIYLKVSITSLSIKVVISKWMSLLSTNFWIHDARCDLIWFVFMLGSCCFIYRRALWFYIAVNCLLYFLNHFIVINSWFFRCGRNCSRLRWELVILVEVLLISTTLREVKTNHMSASILRSHCSKLMKISKLLWPLISILRHHPNLRHIGHSIFSL